MKHIAPVIITVVITAAAAYAQERPRYYTKVIESYPVKVISSAPQSTFSREASKPSEQFAPRTSTPTAGMSGSPYIIVRSAPPTWHGPNASPDAPTSQSRQYMAPPLNPSKTTLTVRSTPRQSMSPPMLSTAKSTLKMRDSRSSLGGYSTGNDSIDSYIVDSSRRYRIDPLLIYSQMGKESSYKPGALSPKGASGLMQLMPKTAERMGVTDIYDPKQNIEGGVRYMRLLLDMFGGNTQLALAGYNAGEGAVIKYGYKVPPYKETLDYVERITARYRSISKLNIALNKF